LRAEAAALERWRKGAPKLPTFESLPEMETQYVAGRAEAEAMSAVNAIIFNCMKILPGFRMSCETLRRLEGNVKVRSEWHERLINANLVE
jgi:hypothetical protein